MHANKIIAALGYLLPTMLCCLSLHAAECTIDADNMDRGETRAFLVCGPDIPSGYTLSGLAEAGITIEYEQYLKMCDIGISGPGIYLVLKAADNATTASIRIGSADKGQPVCQDLSVRVPGRIPLGKAVLADPPGPDLPFKILEINAGESLDISPACTGGIRFPEGACPSLSLLSPEDAGEITPAQGALLQGRLQGPSIRQGDNTAAGTFHPLHQPVCTQNSLRALVMVQGQQRTPAKIILSGVRRADGTSGEAIAFAALPPPEWAGTMPDEDAKYVVVGGIRTRYFEKGNGDALLLVHGGQPGGGGSAQSWEQNFQYLSRYFHVYALDRIGQGYTDNPKTDADYKRHYQQVVEHVYGFIQTMGLRTVHLVGHSQGGWPVTRIALDHPEMVRSLVNIDGSPAPLDPLRRSSKFFGYVLFQLHPPGGPTLYSTRRGLEIESYTLNNITDEMVARTWRLSRLPKMRKAARKMTRFGVHPGSPAFLAMQQKALEEIRQGRLKVPTLLVWGYHDAVMHHDVGMELFKIVSGSDVPGSQLVMFDNCDHFPHLEYPEMFNRLVRDFCGTYAFHTLK